MRIIFLVVFYIIVAKIADGGGDTATKMLGNSMKQFVRQKGRTADHRLSVDDEMARTSNRRNRQLLLANRIGDWSQIRKLSTTSNLRHGKRSLRKSVKDSNDKIRRHQNDFENDGDNENVYTTRSENRPVWKDPEFIDTSFNVNPTRSSMITQEAVSNRSFLKRPGSNLMSPSKRYFLIPVSKDLYVLNNVRDSSRSDGRIISKPYKFTERNRHLSDPSAVNLTPLYPNFLYPHYAFQTRSDVINVPDKSDFTLYDYESMSYTDRSVDTNLNAKINSDDVVLSTSSLKISNYDENATKYDETSQLNSWNYKNSLEHDEFDKLTTTSFRNIFGTFDDNVDAPVSLENVELYSTEDDEKIFVDLPQTARDSLELSIENYEDKNTIDFMDTTSIRYTSNSANTYPLVDNIEKKEQFDGKNPQSLLTAIKPLSSELEKLLNAVKLVNQSIRNVQNRLCNTNDVVRAARIERGNEERKTMDILKLSDNVDHYTNALFKKRLNSQPWRKKRIKNKSVTNQTINDTKFRKKANGSLFLNKLKNHLSKQRKFASAKIDRSDRNFHKKKKINVRKFRNFNDVKNHRSPYLRLNRNLKSLARNDKRYSALHNAKRAMSGEVQRSDEENKHSTIDPQLQKEISAYINVLEILRTQDFAQTTQNITELLLISTTTEIPTTTFLPYFIEEPTATTLSVTTAGIEEFLESTLYEYTTGTKFEYYDERNYTEPYKDYKYEDHEVATSWYNYTESTTTPAILTVEITIEETNTTLTVAIRVEVTETPITIPTIEEFTTESTLLLTPVLEDMTDITLKITIPPAVETLIEETVGEITGSTTSTTEITSSLFTSTSSYGFSITPLFITSETEWIPITTVSVPILTPLITTEETISVTQKTVAVTTISLTSVITTKFTEKELEYTTPFTTQSLAFSTRGPTRATTSTEKTSEYTVTVTITSTTQAALTTTTKRTIEITPTTVSEITRVTTITGLPTTSERPKTVLTTPTETVRTTLTPTEESTVTQIEKTITAEEFTTTETPSTTETPTSVKKLTITTISTTTENKTETGTESITPTETLTTTKIPTIIKTSITASSTITKPIITVETTTVSKTLISGKTTTETSVETSTPTGETLTTTETSIKTSTPTESVATTKITPVKKVTTTTISTTTEGITTTETSTESTTPTETLTTTKISTIIETSTTVSSTITKPTGTVETTVSKTLIPGKTTTETSVETSTPTESLATTKITTPIKKVTISTTISTTTEGTTIAETSTESIIPTEISTTTKIPTVVETSTASPTITETTTEITIETSTQTSLTASTTVISIRTTVPTTLLITSTLSSLITNITLSETPTLSFPTTEALPISTTISTIETTIREETSATTEGTTVTFTTITEELTEEINVTSTPVTERTLTSENVTLISTESSIFVTETNITSVPTTTFTPFFTSLSTLFTTESPAITSESIPMRTTLTEELTTVSTTSSVSISYTESSSIIFTKKTACPTISAEVETEYYVAKGPMYEEEEEYEEYDTEIPTNRWYDYETYEVTEKKETIVTLRTIKHTKPSKITSTVFKETTTSPYRTETSEFTMYSLFTLPTMSTPSYAYTEEEYTPSTIAETSTVVKNLTTIEIKTESLTATEEESTTMETTFGSTEEYTLPSSTVFEIKTKPLPLEYPTVFPEYAETESTSEVSETETKRITMPERGFTETEITGETFVFVSSLLTTLSEKEAVEKYTITTTFLGMETATETGYAVVTLATTTELITEEETVPYVTPFFTRKTEFEVTETVSREQQKDQLLQQLERLKQQEKDLAEKEERLRDEERQWHREKEEREKMLREKEAAKRTTGITTASYVATEVASIFVATSITTLKFGLIEVTSHTMEIETITEGTSMTYTTEKTTLYITEESTFTKETEKMSTVELYDTSLFSVPTATASTAEMYATSYGIVYLSEPSLTPTFTSPIALIIEEFTTSTTPYTTEEVVYTTEYVPVYSELLFISSTTAITSPITFVGEFTASPVAFSETFEEIDTLFATFTKEKAYTAAYEDIYGTPSFTSPTLIFTATTSVGSTTETVGTTMEIRYDEEIEELREKLREKERELDEREKILLEREERLRKDILEFERYVKEFEKDEMEETLIALLTEPTVSTSFSTPVPPTEKTTKLEATTQVTKVTAGKTEYIFEETVTQKEEKIPTKRICLNVLENTTIPVDKTRRDVVAKEICLPYFPEKKRSLGRVNRKLLAFQSAKEIDKSKRSYPSDLRYKRKSRTTAATYKINNLQLFHHEWLSNETTRPPRHFKGFTRLYKKLRRSFLRDDTTNGQQSVADYSHRTSLCEHCVFDRDDNFIRSTTLKENRKRNAFFEHDLNSENKNSFNDEGNIDEQNNLPIEENQSLLTENNSLVNSLKHKSTTVEEEKPDENENGSFTVNVLRLGYNKDEDTHELISAKPNQDELTAIISESYDDYVNNKNYVEEEHDKPFDTDRKPHQTVESDYVEDYINYEEEPRGIFSHTRGETEFLNQVWPTEKSTTYHLGGTRFWTLDFEITEPPPAVFSVTPENKPVDTSATTCLHVVIKNGRAEFKRNLYSNETRKHNSLVEKRDVDFPNVRRTSNRSGAMIKDLNLKSRKMHKTKYHGEKKMRHSELSPRRVVSIINEEDSVIAKSRKLCGVNESKLKHQIAKHKDTAKTTRESKKKQLGQLKTTQNVDSSKVCTNSCVTNKKNSHNYHKTMTVKTNHHLSKARTSGKKNVAKVTTRPDNVANRNSKSKPVSVGSETHDCLNCICDVMNVIDNIKSILDKMNSPLDEIRTLNCSRFKDTQDKIVISMDSNVEETKEFPQLHYNTESLKGQKYIKLDELEDNFKNDFEFTNDHDIFSLPGLSLNLPCNQEGDGITWLSSISRPRYTWRRTDGIALFGFVSENGDLELRNVNAKDTGNYTCVMTYMSPDNEEPVEATYEVHLQVITLPRYTVHGENRYHTRSCDERDLDVLVTYLPLKLNSIICEMDICNAYVLTPTCSRNQIAVNVLLVPSRIVKLMTVDPKHCNVFCLKAIQDKLSLILGRNLQIFLGKTIIFRLPHYEQRLVPIAEKSSFGRWKRGKTTSANTFRGGFGNIGLFSSCPAGYGLRGTRCVPCNTGTYSEDGISHCKKCPPGTYQPNHGARVCRSCTNPLKEGCYNMLWNSFSAVMITLASFSVMIFIFLLLLWICCYIKKKFCMKKIATMISKEKEYVEKQPLMNDVSENEDQQWDSEYKIKNKKGKFYKKRRKQNEKRKYEKTNTEGEWESHRLKNKSFVCPDSYRSHEEFNNHYPKHSYRKGPQLPECDFDT